METQALATTDTLEVNQQGLLQSDSVFSIKSFDHAQRVAKMLSSSNLIPKDYQGNIQNTMIALEMATRIGASPLMVMQNLHVIQGRPSWSSPFIIAALNSCGRFQPLRFKIDGEGEQYGCTAWTVDKKSETLTGPKVTWEMVKAEGWYGKPGSKWKTMPELMFRYRSAAFFGRLYAPDILMGMHSVEEVVDVDPVIMSEQITREDLLALFEAKKDKVDPLELPGIQRILDNNETNSFNKVHKILSAI